MNGVRLEQIYLPRLTAQATAYDQRLLRALYDQFRDVGWKIWNLNDQLTTGRIAFTAQATSATLVSNTAYFVTANTLTLTLPASPVNNDWIIIANGGAYTGSTVARNGKNIMGLAENMALDPTNYAIKLVYLAASSDWRVT